jgi:hypothetical protein
MPRLVKGAPDLWAFAQRNGGFGIARDDKFMAGLLPSWPPDAQERPKSPAPSKLSFLGASPAHDMIFRAFNRLEILDDKAVRIPRNLGGG